MAKKGVILPEQHQNIVELAVYSATQSWSTFRFYDYDGMLTEYALEIRWLQNRMKVPEHQIQSGRLTLPQRIRMRRKVRKLFDQTRKKEQKLRVFAIGMLQLDLPARRQTAVKRADGSFDFVCYDEVGTLEQRLKDIRKVLYFILPSTTVLNQNESPTPIVSVT